MSNSTTDHNIDQDNCLACQEERKAPMTLPDDIELYKTILAKIMGATTMLDEQIELIATYRKKWEAEARVDELGNFLDVVVRHDKSRLETNEWYKLNPQDISSYYAKRLTELQGENK